MSNVGSWLQIEVDGRRGFIDRSGQEIIAPSFDFVRYLGDQRAFVRQGKRGVVVDASGREVFEIDAFVLMPAREGLYPMMRQGSWGFIDEAGQEVIAPTFDSVFLGFEGGVVRVSLRDGRQVLIDREGQEVLPGGYEICQSPRAGLVPFKHKKKWGLFSVQTREVVIEPTFADIFGMHGEHWILKKSAKKWGAANAAGAIVIAPTLPWLNAIVEDRGATRDKNAAIGFVDATGATIIDHCFESRGGQDDLSRFSDGRCSVQVDGKIGFIDRGGELVVPASFVNGFFYGEGRGTVVDEGGWTYIDETGRAITEERFNRAETFAGGFGVVSRGSLNGAINSAGALVVPVVCSSITVGDGLLTLMSQSFHTGYFRADGSLIWKHAEFDVELA